MSEVIGKLWRRRPGAGRRRAAVIAPRMPFNEAESQPPAPDDSRYINREISDLQFIERVMQEVHNRNHPLLERLRFLSISASVLDQFYAVRVAKLKRAAHKIDAYVTPDGMTPITQLKTVLQRGEVLIRDQQSSWEGIREELVKSTIDIARPDQLDVSEIDWLQHFFRNHVLPLLTPCTADEEHPLPFIASGDVCAILEFPDRHILIPLPSKLPRFILLPGERSRFVLLESALFRFWPDLFPHDTLLSHGVFQLLRDNDLARQKRSDDLRSMVESGLKQRHKAHTVLLKVSDTLSERAIAFVATRIDLLNDEELLFLHHQGKRPSESRNVMATSLPDIASISDILLPEITSRYRNLLFEQHQPREIPHAEYESVFERIACRDILVHWPYESFSSVIEFLEQAATDPDVQAIKQTLYRTSDDSPVVEALINAARNGKAVTTVIELEARENESSNVRLAKRLEAAGVHIVYGIVGLKVHCKVTLVARREEDDTVLYSHFSTGNYHPGNARSYTDLSYFTSDQDLGRDANTVFNYITSGTLLPTKKLLVAPIMLRNRLFELIDNEIALARSGKRTHIYIKVNSLTDPPLIERLYAASEAGVDIDLVVRRHCSLRPGVDGMSSRIRVKSIVGRFLEHSRIYLFSNGHPAHSSSAHVFIGSPDLMERNLDERVELLVPIMDAELRHRIVNEIMHANIMDSKQSWNLLSDNTYQRAAAREGSDDFCAQTFFLEPVDIGLLKS